MRIGIARINSETNAFSPEATRLDDFERFHLLDEAGVAKATGRFRAELPGLALNAELSGARRAIEGAGAEAVPLMSAWALPSGPLTEATERALIDRLLDAIDRAGPLDGLYLALHGAMRSEAGGEPEERILGAVKAAHPSLKVAVSYDLHGQMTAPKVELPDVVTAYRTNPHRDLRRVGERSAELLVRTLRGEIHPTVAWRTLPLVFGGGSTLDFLRPMRKVFRLLKKMEKDPRVLYASAFTVHVWSDSKDLGWSAVVLTDGDQALGERLAEEVADALWSVRDVAGPELHEPAEAFTVAERATFARKTGAVFFSDTGDTVGAGALGESTHVLAEALKHPRLTTYVPIRDAAVVEELFERPTGADVSVSVGGKLAPEVHAPLPLTGRLIHRGRSDYFGRHVTIDAGPAKVIVTEQAPYTLKPSFWTDAGLSPWKADVIVVKSLFHFRIYHAHIARKYVGVRCGGTTDFDAFRTIDFHEPVYPVDSVVDWRPADRRRRGLAESSAQGVARSTV
jgi:microcystin degradation protein MlrC